MITFFLIKKNIQKLKIFINRVFVSIFCLFIDEIWLFFNFENFWPSFDFLTFWTFLVHFWALKTKFWLPRANLVLFLPLQSLFSRILYIIIAHKWAKFTLVHIWSYNMTRHEFYKKRCTLGWTSHDE